MKQTAVEWLIEQLKENNMLTFDEWTGLFEQAKEMEKQQIIDFADNYGFDICGYDYQRAEQYYKETFKSE